MSTEESASKKRKIDDISEEPKLRKPEKIDAPDEGVYFTLREGRNPQRVSIKKFKGKWYVDFRNYYLNKEDEVKPTGKGLMMPLDVFDDLKALMPSIVNEVAKVAK